MIEVTPAITPNEAKTGSDAGTSKGKVELLDQIRFWLGLAL